MTQLKIKIKKGDTVKVMSGKFKGKTGTVEKKLIDKKNPNKCKVHVSGVTMKKHVKPSQEDAGGIKDIPYPLNICKVMYMLADGTTTRIGKKTLDDGTKVRYAKKTGEVLEG